MIAAAGVLGALALVAAAPIMLSGNWAGDRYQLRVTEAGIVVQTDCASGKLNEPVMLDEKGRFTAAGYFNPDHAAMSLAAIGPTDQPATFSGEVRGTTLRLTIQRSGKPAEHHMLHRDGRLKLVRCL